MSYFSNNRISTKYSTSSGPVVACLEPSSQGRGGTPAVDTGHTEPPPWGIPET
jgi:hypothetical protein